MLYPIDDMQVLGFFVIKAGTVQIYVGIGLKILGIVVAPSLTVPFAGLADKAVAVNLGAHEVGSRNQNGTYQQGDDDGREFRLIGRDVVGNEGRQYQGEDERLEDHQKDAADPQWQSRRFATALFHLVQIVCAFVVEGCVLVHALIITVVFRAEFALSLIPGRPAFFTILHEIAFGRLGNETHDRKADA